jgi:hypothetical protein
MGAKRAVYNGQVLSILLFGCESRVLVVKLLRLLRGFHVPCLRAMCRVTMCMCGISGYPRPIWRSELEREQHPARRICIPPPVGARGHGMSLEWIVKRRCREKFPRCIASTMIGAEGAPGGVWASYGLLEHADQNKKTRRCGAQMRVWPTGMFCMSPRMTEQCGER